MGVISAKQRRVDESRYSRIQTDASINPGNSGGPLLNIRGEVVGVNQSIISPGAQGGSVGIGFAIPINEVKSVLDVLKEEKRVIGRPSLGVQLGVPGRDLRRELGIGEETEGLLVVFVSSPSAAEDAGIRENDFILSANGESLKEPKDLVRETQRVGVGGKMLFEVYREGETITLEVIVGEGGG